MSSLLPHMPFLIVTPDPPCSGLPARQLPSSHHPLRKPVFGKRPWSATAVTSVHESRTASPAAGSSSVVASAVVQPHGLEDVLLHLATEKGAEPRGSSAGHAALLHRYNDIKDAAQLLLGLVAEKRSVGLHEVYFEMGIDEEEP